jgi:hypothetical protein
MKRNVEMRIAGNAGALRLTASAHAWSYHARFAAQVTARYATWSPARRKRLAMIFARPWTLQTFIHRHWHRLTLLVAPRVHLRLQANRRVAASIPEGAGISFARVEQDAVQPLRRFPQDVVEYVHARSRRVEPTFGGRILPVEPPVPRVVRRLAPVSTTGTAAATADSGVRPLDRDDARSRTRNALVPPAAAFDMERLTEQVIKGIDRRIIARRERLGRI